LASASRVCRQNRDIPAPQPDLEPEALEGIEITSTDYRRLADARTGAVKEQSEPERLFYAIQLIKAPREMAAAFICT